MNTILLMKQDWNLPPSYFSNLLLVCHLVVTGIKLPGAMTDFNQQVVEAVSLKFGQLALHSDYITLSQLDAHKNGLDSAGYRVISASSNLGFTFWTLFILTKLFLVISNIILFFVKTRTRCGQLRLRSLYIHILENISTPSYINFELSSSIVQLTSGFIYLRF